MSNNLKTLSVVIPCHNESEVIRDTCATLINLLDPYLGQLISAYELVLVNNGSTDNTLKAMLQIFEKHPNIVVLDLRNNYGYQGSITAGMYNANNDLIITIDADLQDDPTKMGEMLTKYYEGFDLVLGIRDNRDEDTIWKRWSAEWYYALLNMMAVKSIPQHGDYRLISRPLLEELKKYPERNRYLRGLILSLDNHYATVHYKRTKRTAGETKFRLGHLLGLAIDGISSFSAVPIRVITLVGCLVFVCSIFIFLYVLYVKFIAGVDVPGWAFLSILITFFGSMQSVFLGIIGEYLSKNYLESKQRPLYLIRKKYTS